MSRLRFFPNQWASGEIRGRQVAVRLGDGVVVDSNKVYADDVCVFIKNIPPDNVIKHVKCVYVDVVDGYGLIPWLKEHSEVGVITSSPVGKTYLSEQLHRDDIIVIPPHHCNFERALRVQKEEPIIQTVGFVGYIENLHLDVDKVQEALAELHIEFRTKTKFSIRQEVCDFYQGIDIQLTFRKPDDKINPAPKLRDVTKLINAGSFGIPTIACPEPTYVDEFDGCFLPVESLEDIVEACRQLQQDGWLYYTLAKAALERAEQYHIDRVLPLWRALLDDEPVVDTEPAVVDGISLDLGCGINKHDGWTGMDARACNGVDIVHNVQDFPWPLDDNSCSRILMQNLYEHIEPKYRIQLIDECWRVMKPSGQLIVSSPYAGSVRAFQDPTHYTCPNEVTAKYFDPDYPYYYLVYSPRPWKIVKNDYLIGNVNVVLEARK